GMGLVVIATGGKALFLLLKLGKFVLLLALPAWAMTRAAFHLMFARFPRPEGRPLTPAQAPRLFERLHGMRARIGGPPVHTVLVTGDINAAIAQHPRMGLFGWHENILILGLPLLQALGEEEALAVVAHEYGHLAGNHSRLGGFIYRLRSSWGALEALSAQWQDWGSKLIARLVGWYAPYFNAYTFVLARQNEYLADRTAAELVGREHAANALMRVNIAARFEDADFWPSVLGRIAELPDPVENRSALWSAALHDRLGADERARFLDAARKRRTDHHDTHPALADRLAAIGVEPDAAAAQGLAPPAISAAQAWLGPSLAAVCSDLDGAWRTAVSGRWHDRHTHLKECARRLQEIEAADPVPVEQQWERVTLIRELRPEQDVLPLVEAVLERDPEHRQARFRRGTLLLDRGQESGIADLEAVMAADEEAILPGCEAAWQFYQERAPEKAEDYRARWQARAGHVQRVRTELSTLTPAATLAPAQVTPEQLACIRRLVRANGRHIRRAWLVRRILASDPKLSDHVLLFETSRWTLGDKGDEVSGRLAALEFPLHLFIVNLGAKPFKPLRRQILGIEPLDLSGVE
ncbi:MAG: M48 family metallopeptidase, partial [Gammaproteobacteria bacterium]